jgi:4-diphosphocytidyl-2-C-methyl-D-erythritol kinase
VKLRALAPAKVNLCLFLGPTRGDGRHELVTVFQSLSLADELQLETLAAGPDEVVCAGVEGENLALRAIETLRARGWGGPPVRIRIDKRIPVAGGMAGGSADAAAALRLAMAIAPGRPEEVDAIAASLGADVPSQLTPGLALGVGAGELVERFEPLAPHAFVIVRRDEPLATPAVFREADRLGLPRTRDALRELYRQLGASLSPGARLPDDLIVNDLEPAAVSLCPAIASTLGAVREAGADHALVSGSGPTVIGLFWGDDARARAERARTRLRGRFTAVSCAEPVDDQYASPSAVSGTMRER